MSDDLDLSPGPADYCHAALVDVGRPDLAMLCQWFEDDDGSLYLEPLDGDLLSPADLAIMVKAEAVALAMWRAHRGVGSAS